MSELTDQIIRASLHRFLGRLAADPEIKYLETGTVVCNARLLVNKPGAKRDDGQQPDGFKLEIWFEKAQAFADAARKGDMVDVTGRVKSESWTDRNTGEQRTGLVIAVEVFSVQPRQAAAPAAAAAAPAPAPAARAAVPF
jgi:single-strand DNA-binding protein